MTLINPLEPAPELSYNYEGRGKMTKPAISSTEIRRICGDIPDWKVAAIQAERGDINALEQAAAWASGDDETPPMRHLPPESPAGRIHAVLTAGEEEEEDFAQR